MGKKKKTPNWADNEALHIMPGEVLEIRRINRKPATFELRFYLEGQEKMNAVHWLQDEKVEPGTIRQSLDEMRAQVMRALGLLEE